ncbi:hypothetical protein PENSPDRAFT_751688 [Peniophora sp. CONT]|nr:hypothetical protein PENSPDRAFT_751688 [Peniophora sp. CONT]
MPPKDDLPLGFDSEERTSCRIFLERISPLPSRTPRRKVAPCGHTFSSTARIQFATKNERLGNWFGFCTNKNQCPRSRRPTFFPDQTPLAHDKLRSYDNFIRTLERSHAPPNTHVPLPNMSSRSVSPAPTMLSDTDEPSRADGRTAATRPAEQHLRIHKRARHEELVAGPSRMAHSSPILATRTLSPDPRSTMSSPPLGSIQRQPIIVSDDDGHAAASDRDQPIVVSDDEEDIPAGPVLPPIVNVQCNLYEKDNRRRRFNLQFEKGGVFRLSEFWAQFERGGLDLKLSDRIWYHMCVCSGKRKRTGTKRNGMVMCWREVSFGDMELEITSDIELSWCHDMGTDGLPMLCGTTKGRKKFWAKPSDVIVL